MLKIFKKRKNEKNKETGSVPVEEEISLIINKYTRLRLNYRKSNFIELGKAVKSYEKSEIYSLCSSSDQFPLSIIINGSIAQKEDFIKEIHELTKMEVLQYSYTGEYYEELLWSFSDSDLYSNDNFDYFISIKDYSKEMIHNYTIEITQSREFSFGQILVNNLYINRSPVAVSYKQMRFSEETIERDDYKLFQSTLQIDGKEMQLFIYLKGIETITAIVAKAVIKEQKNSLEQILGKTVKIASAGIAEENQKESFSGYSLSGRLHTTGADIPYVVLFPRKLINLFPDYKCSSIKGKILQINKELFRRDFTSFYKPFDQFLLADFLSVSSERDLNLICQNFFVANSIHGDNLRKLFFYKVKLKEKSRINREPFIYSEAFINHLPVRLREEFQQSRIYSQSHEELIRENEQILKQIFNRIKEQNLLLSFRSQSILHKETGIGEEKSKTLRLRKLIGDKRFINLLEKMDSKKVQVMLSNMKNVLIADTFIYQTDELVKLKPFLSKNRFEELKEDISFTQGKIKSNQIDMNRICDSIENFNRYVKNFVEKDRKKEATSKSSSETASLL